MSVQLASIQSKRELHEAQEGRGQFVVASRHATTMLDAIDKSFDYVAELVPFAVMSANATIVARRDDRFGTVGASLPAQWITIVPLVADHALRFEAFQKDARAGYVVPLSYAQMQLGRLALAVDRNVDFGAETATGRSRGRNPCRDPVG